jgi:hypothetical protein
MFKMKVKSTKTLFLRCLTMHKKMIIILAIISLFAPGFLPYGLSNSNITVKNKRVSHAKLCCCNKVASTCRDCCCSDGPTENDNTGKSTVTITACGGTSDDIITVSKLNFFLALSVIVNYLPVTTLAETATLQLKYILEKPPFKPPKPQLLTHFI